MFVGMLVIYFIYSSSAEPELTTLSAFTMDIPNSDPVEIIEGDPSWEKWKGVSDSSHRYRKWASTSANNLNHSLVSNDEEDDTSELTQSVLRDYLDKYAENVKRDKSRNEQHSNYNEEKNKKSWNMIMTHHHNHPYDDKSGWVSLDPVPWSLSKISKWHNRPKPTEIPWNDYLSTKQQWVNELKSHIPHQNNYKYKSDLDRNTHHYVNNGDLEKAQYSRVPNIYEERVHMQVTPSILQNIHKVGTDQQYNQNYEGIETEDIITDDQPSDFPLNHIQINRRFGPEQHQTKQSFMKDGEWVLLSTSKGFKYPKKPRSLKLNPEFIGTRKSVHITVLPPLKGSNINMTTSHGGLLQVESTFETVEQAQKKIRMRKHQIKKPKRPGKLLKRKRKVVPQKNTLESTIATIPRSTRVSENDSNAVLAGVGAGLIPATMAMFVPVAMNAGK